MLITVKIFNEHFFCKKVAEAYQSSSVFSFIFDNLAK